MKKIIPQYCSIADNRRLDADGRYFRLKVADFKPVRPVYPGQFVHIKVADAYDPFFRRAFSIADYDPATRRLEIIYKVVGKGTSTLAIRRKGDSLDVLGPLGNRFSAASKTKTVALVAGGIGFPPLIYLAKALLSRGFSGDQLLFFYGGRTKTDLIELRRIRALGVHVFPCTDDGSYGFKGFVTEAVMQRLADANPKGVYIYGCGPEPMLATLQESAMRRGYAGELSLEAPMPCGVGVCLGCIKPTLDNPRKYVRVCYDGPVFKLGEVKL